MANASDIAKDQLVDDFKAVIADAEALLQATVSHTGENVAEVRAKAEKSIQLAKASLTEIQSVMIARTKEVAKATDVYVHENPWKSVGFASSVGLVIGLLISRR